MMRMKPRTAILITLAVFIAGIIVTSAAGLWNTKSSKTPKRLQEVQFTEQYDPADIRGSYTFSDISRLYGIPLEDLSDAFGVAENDASAYKCKDLESMNENSTYEIGTSSVRMFAAYYLGLPYHPAEETYLSDAAAIILNEKGNITQEQSDYLKRHTVQVD